MYVQLGSHQNQEIQDTYDLSQKDKKIQIKFSVFQEKNFYQGSGILRKFNKLRDTLLVKIWNSVALTFDEG